MMPVTAKPQTTQEPPYFDTLPPEQRNALMRRKFMETGRFHQDFGKDWANLPCEPFGTLLRQEVIRILESKGVDVPAGALESLHEHISPELKAYGFNDGVNKISTLLYDTDAAFMQNYLRFIRECVQKHFPYPFLFQAIPTIRIHCPDGENSHHYPRYHTDINYGHPPEEINLWIPLTHPVAPQQHGFRMMSLEQSREVLEPFDYAFAPFIEQAISSREFNTRLNAFSPQVATPLGSIFAFDSRCIHTAEAMVAHTRVSIDIRIMHKADYAASEVRYQGVGRRKIRYVPGEAYHACLSTEL